MGLIYTIPYVMLVMVVGFLALFYYQADTDEDKNRITLILAGVFLFFFGFRGYILTDWVIYLPQYENMRWDKVFNYFTTINNNFEPGFAILVMICKSVFPSYFFLCFVIVSFNIYALIVFFKRYTNNIPLGFILFLVFEGVIIMSNLLRNSISISIFLLALPFLENRKPIRYFSMCILASSFHISALLYIPLYFFLHIRFSKWIYIALFVFINAAFVSHVSIVMTLVQLLGMDESMAMKVKAYTELYSSSISVFSIGYLERLASGILVILYYEKISEMHKGKGTIINAFLLFLSFYFLFSEFEVFAKRICTLFAFGYWVIWGDLIRCFYYKNNRKFFLCFVIMYSLLKTVLVTRYPGYDYQNILFGADNYNERLMYHNKTYQGK